MTLALAFLAGLLSLLSPCVLPLVPLVLGAALSEHRLGPAAVAAGLAVSFVAIGMFVATVGFSIGLDTGVFRSAAAGLLVLIGVVLLVPQFQARLAIAAGPMGDWTEQHFGGFSAGGLAGQFGVGLLLGAVWTPCVGPTLGAASLLAARGEDLGQVTLTMLAFGIGTALPLVLLGLLSREAMLRWRYCFLSTGRRGKTVLGLVLLTTGTLILTGWDKSLEAALVDVSPQWVIDLTTRF